MNVRPVHHPAPMGPRRPTSRQWAWGGEAPPVSRGVGACRERQRRQGAAPRRQPRRAPPQAPNPAGAAALLRPAAPVRPRHGAGAADTRLAMGELRLVCEASGAAATVGVAAATSRGEATPQPRHAPAEEAQAAGGGWRRCLCGVAPTRPAAAGQGGGASAGGLAGCPRGGNGRGGGEGERDASPSPTSRDGHGVARGWGGRAAPPAPRRLREAGGRHWWKGEAPRRLPRLACPQATDAPRGAVPQGPTGAATRRRRLGEDASARAAAVGRRRGDGGGGWRQGGGLFRRRGGGGGRRNSASVPCVGKISCGTSQRERPLISIISSH